MPKPIGFKAPKDIGFKNNNLKGQFNQGKNQFSNPKSSNYYKPTPNTDSFMPEAEVLFDNDYNKALQSNEETESSLSNSNEDDTNFGNSGGFATSAFGNAANAGGASAGFATAGFGSAPTQNAGGFGTGGFGSAGFGANAPARNDEPTDNADWGDSQQNGSW
uniref:Uncharacterized protein n=1 Tax=Ditylenchus dipsaci TaxID=166011 RepID=A0A915D9M3_9BILA